MNEIILGLYLGGIYALEEGTYITSNRIKTVITCGEFFCEFHKPHLKNLERIKIKIRDNKESRLLEHISKVNEFIHRNRLEKKNVFIHCFGGVSRSVAFAIAYLMTISSMDLEKALRFVKSKRKGAQPNDGFMEQLERFQNEGVQEEKRRLDEKFSEHRRFQELCEDDMKVLGH